MDTTNRDKVVLLVDDELGLLRVLARTVVAMGYQVHTAPSATEALALLAIVRVDVVVTDISLGGMNGCALAREVVRRWPGTRILLTSGYNYEVTQLADCIPGMPLLSKAFKREQIEARLTQVLAEAPWTPPEGR